ncbi:MAG: DUF3299 domain-containing protein [Casimicrobiaceae bacterium]
MRNMTHYLGIALVAVAGTAAAINTGVGSAGLPSATSFSATLLPEREGVVSWQTLAQVQPVKQGGKIVYEYAPGILALDRKDVKVQGFMIPLDIGDKQRRFLLSAVPPHCTFCLPAGADAIVEVEATTPVTYTFDPIVVSGRFAVQKDDGSGVLFKMTNAGRVEVGNAPAKPASKANPAPAATPKTAPQPR